MPFADEHRFLNGDAVEMAFAPTSFVGALIEGIWTANHGGGGAETRMVCGFIELSEFLFAPVFRSLPELLVERRRRGQDRRHDRLDRARDPRAGRRGDGRARR